MSKSLYNSFSIKVSQVQDQAHKITLKGIFSIAAYQTLQEKILRLSEKNSEDRIYLIFDFMNFESIPIDVKKWINENRIYNNFNTIYITFGLNNVSKTIIRYLFQNAIGSNVFHEDNEHAAIKLVNTLLSENMSNNLSVGPTSITGLIKKTVKLKDKTFSHVHDKQWAYVQPDESYFYEIDLIDNNVFVSRPSGYIEYENSLTANVLFDKVVYKVLPKDSQYYRIQDYENVVKSSLSARRDFTQYIANNIDRINLLIFYGLNRYMKAVVQFGKLFHPKFYKVKVANSFEEALQLVMEHKYGKKVFNEDYKPSLPKQNDAVIEEEVKALRNELYHVKTKQQEKLDRIFYHIGSIMWDSNSDPIQDQNNEESAFSDVFSALEMLKVDIKELADNRESTILDLQGQLNEKNKEILKINKELQNVLKKKAVLIQKLNHGLRTPIQNIQSTIELLKLSKDDKDSERLINMIADSSILLNKKIINKISLANIDEGEVELSSNIFNLNNALKSKIELIKPVILGKNIEIIQEFDQEIPPYLIGDLDKIDQVIDHFLDNAIKHTNEGTITIRTILIDNSESQITIRFEVEDTGVGINKNIQELLFDDTNIVKPDSGRNSRIGLGLFICKQHVELMGGDIGFSSKENIGSSFYFIVTLNIGSSFKG